MNIAICDSEKLDSKKITQLLEQYRALGPYEVAYVLYESGAALSEAMLCKQFDLYMMDVLLPSGIETAQKVRAMDADARIVLLTGARGLSAETSDVRAYRHISVPLTPQKLFPLLDALRGELEERKSGNIAGSITLKSKAGLSKIHLTNIECLEFSGRKLRYHLVNNEVIEVHGTMAQAERQLLGYPQFIKPHRSYIVNMDYIDIVTSGEIRTTHHIHVPISRSSQFVIKQKYFDYSVISQGRPQGKR